MTTGRAVLGWALAIASVLATLIVARTNEALPRALSTLVIVAGPGLAWVPMLEIRDRAFQVLLCLLTSVTAVILVAQVVTYAAGFSWRPVEFSLLAITLIGLSAQGLVALIRVWREELR
jgi:hypothetical protein